MPLDILLEIYFKIVMYPPCYEFIVLRIGVEEVLCYTPLREYVSRNPNRIITSEFFVLGV